MASVLCNINDGLATLMTKHLNFTVIGPDPYYEVDRQHLQCIVTVVVVDCGRADQLNIL